MAQIPGGNLLVALLAGMTGGLIVSALCPAAEDPARPAAKRVIKSGLLLYERGIETLAEWAESTSDLLAEVRSELQEERFGAVTDSSSGPTSPRPAEDAHIVPLKDRSHTEAKLHG